MAIITPALLTALNTAFQKHFTNGVARAQSTYKEIATVIPSTTKSNTYGWLGQFPKMREWIGSRVLKDMAAHGYTITNKDYEASISVLRTDIEDDNIGNLGTLIDEMGYAATIHPDELIYLLLSLGHNELCFDGQNFFDTDHPVYPEVDGTGTAKVVSNLFEDSANPTTPWFLLDTSRALKPLIWQERKKPVFTLMTDDKDEEVFMRNTYRYGVDSRGAAGFGFWQMAARSTYELNVDNFDMVFSTMRAQQADGGRPLDIRPTVLVVPTTLETKAKKLINTEKLPNNVDNPFYKSVKIHATPWLNV